MKKGKKVLIIALIAVIALAGTIGGVALAQDEEETSTTTPETARIAMLERVCEIYQEKTGVAIDAETLQDSLCQAGQEKMDQARNQFRQRLIDEGILTEEQLSELEEWLQARPDLPTEEFKAWMEARPDNLPQAFGFGQHDGKRFAFGLGYRLGRGPGGGFGGLCQPDNGTQ